MTLTEQWKKGELPCGHYYVIFDKNDTPEISRCVYKVIILSKPEVRDFEDFGVEEVLAPVPSYEEWQELIDKKNWCNARAKNLLEKNQKLKEENAQLIKFLEEFNALDIAKENQQLKELLKECKPYITQAVSRNFYEDDVSLRARYLNKDSLLTKIYNAIGEKK